MITYIGFFVAALIIAWAVVEIGRRFYKRGKIDSRVMNTWVSLQPSARAETENDDQDDSLQQDTHDRARQNGHYSESKKL